MSPANVKRHNTPAKRPRISLSPEKSAHSIRFDDVLLPGSPTMKLDGRQRSLSPAKDLSEGNVSPWRIRVTLEATQDEENQGNPPRKRLRPSTVTTKVPLKDERSPLTERTPKRRGRPRKSDARTPNGSPFPGSPGHTPGPRGGSPQKGKRGRPRKGTPKPKAKEPMLVDEEPPPTAAPDSPLDIAADVDTGPGQQSSPMDLGVNGDLWSDSFGADDLPVADLRDITGQTNQPDAEVWDNSTREYGRASYGTPVIGATYDHLDNDDENLHSTPSKMPSPTLDRLASFTRNKRNAVPPPPPPLPRTYPTPTSSVEEENQSKDVANQASETDKHHVEPNSTSDPTDEHREFDSVMESEGFSMVSLNTLPSARQHGLGSSKLASSSALKPFLERENGGTAERLKRKLPGTIDDLRDKQASTVRSPALEHFSPRSPARSRADFVPDYSTASAGQRSKKEISYPELPVSHLAEEMPKSLRRKPSLARLVRVGIALQGTFRPQEGEGSRHDNIGRKRRLENVFSSFSPDTQRELRAALNLGQELAERQGRREDERAREIMETEDQASLENQSEEEQDEPVDEVQDVEEAVISPAAQSEQRDFQHPSPIPVQRAQREAEWQRERKLVSRQAQMANPRSVIYIDDDDDVPQYDEGGVENASDSLSQSDGEPDPEPEPVPEPGPTASHAIEAENEGLYGEDDGSDDIWQQEAQGNSYSQHPRDDLVQQLGSDPVSPWRRIATSLSGGSSSPAYLAIQQNDAPYLGHSHIHRLREEEVDLSAVLAEEDTPNRARYYNGTSTPRSVMSPRSWAQQSSLSGSAVKTAGQHPARQRGRLQPLSQSSPDMDSQDDELEYSAADHENRQSRHLEVEAGRRNNDGDSSISDAAATDTGSAHAESATTPESERPANGDIQTSSWFQRITNLTPRWLRAPTSARKESAGRMPERELEDDDQEDEVASIESAREIHDYLKKETVSRHSSKSPSDASLELQPKMEEQDHIPSIEKDELSSPQETEEDSAADQVDDRREYGTGPRPLAVFGYFSDDHYNVLRRVHRMAQRFPERFPYYATAGRAAIIGDWIWTSDGHHGVPITQLQFAIIDRFVQELSRADIQYGGSGQVDWTEAELHRRLISIIIGEQIREERKAKANRGTSVDTWR